MRVDGFSYVGAGNSGNKKDAQANAVKDFVQYLVRQGKIPASQVPVEVCMFEQFLKFIKSSTRVIITYCNFYVITTNFHSVSVVCRGFYQVGKMENPDYG